MNFFVFLAAFVAGTAVLATGIAWLERRHVADWLFQRLFHHVAMQRLPDFTVGERHDPYLQRWWLLPRNRFFNVYLHCFMRSDDDRALHDHPWHSLSLLLNGESIEHTIAAGGIHERRWLCAGDIRFRSATFAHRIELPPNMIFGNGYVERVSPLPCWTLFLTGPVLRDWGFHCTERGWIPWQRFTDPSDKGLVGKGCDA